MKTMAESDPKEPVLATKTGQLARQEIIEAVQNGSIIIHPYDESCIGTCSVDVRLGPHYYRENPDGKVDDVFDITNPSDIRCAWEYEKAKRVRDARGLGLLEGTDISDDDLVIVVHPGQTILAHTIEFIGGRDNGTVAIASQMRARSGIGRCGLTTCKCASSGDIGFYNRWTMEISNLTTEFKMVLPVGIRIAQIVFFYAASRGAETNEYLDTGTYQRDEEIESLIRRWRHTDMLPTIRRKEGERQYYKYIPDDLRD